jgi:hypothetical protein
MLVEGADSDHSIVHGDVPEGTVERIRVQVLCHHQLTTGSDGIHQRLFVERLDCRNTHDSALDCSSAAANTRAD